MMTPVQVELARKLLADLTDEQRHGLRHSCSGTILAQLMPPPPTDEQVARAKQMLELLDEYERRHRSTTTLRRQLCPSTRC